MYSKTFLSWAILDVLFGSVHIKGNSFLDPEINLNFLAVSKSVATVLVLELVRVNPML